jgi:hypothetical protein
MPTPSWTAAIILKERDLLHGNALRVRVRFSDGLGSSFTEDYTIDSSGHNFTWLKAQVADRIKTLQVIDADPFPPGTIDTSDVIPVPPTVAELAKADFATRLTKLRRVQSAVTIGVLPANTPQIATLLTGLQSDMKPEYLDLF